MGVPAAEMEAVLASPAEMERRVFCRAPLPALHTFRDAGYEQSVALIGAYFLHRGHSSDTQEVRQ
jgi:hypothetical protein